MHPPQACSPLLAEHLKYVIPPTKLSSQAVAAFIVLCSRPVLGAFASNTSRKWLSYESFDGMQAMLLLAPHCWGISIIPIRRRSLSESVLLKIFWVLKASWFGFVTFQDYSSDWSPKDTVRRLQRGKVRLLPCFWKPLIFGWCLPCISISSAHACQRWRCGCWWLFRVLCKEQPCNFPVWKGGVAVLQMSGMPGDYSRGSRLCSTIEACPKWQGIICYFTDSFGAGISRKHP